MGVIALGVLLMACFNYSSLATAMVAHRCKEIAIRKTLGASRKQILGQLFTETAILIVIALPLSIALIETTLPVFNKLLQLNVKFSLFEPVVYVILLSVVLLTSCLSGLYPILVLSAIKPVAGMRRIMVTGKSGRFLMRMAVIFQITLSAILLFSTGAVQRQMDFLLKKDLGLDFDNVIHIKASSGIKKHFDTFRDELLQDPTIHNVSASLLSIRNIETTIGSSWSFKGCGEKKNLEVHFDRVTTDFAHTLGINMALGRFFSPEHPADRDNGVVLNQTAVDLMGIREPLGKVFSFWGYHKTIIGVTEDFHFEPLQESIKPLVLVYGISPNHIYIKIAGDNVQGALERIQSVMSELDPTAKPEFSFLKDRYYQIYSNINEFGGLLSISTVIAMLVAALGIFGLVSFIVEKRRREVAIRKVLGASLIRVSGNVISGIVILAAVSSMLGASVSFILIRKWLEGFAYRSGMGLDTYAQIFGVIIFLVVVSVMHPVLKAITSNPADGLRYE
jgi:ABC-type antimicrobial peptide transport system permease subunit